ncbi:MAG: hypothetical protein M1813_006452 [Trichoglossum hirsutum]|nr:MAG: hypothetical protein M1813_007464 [Trichoglossum hirsutum]KAI9859909.1 MAG: hypothetical protein M1813_006452 [Trichoglossum hirsutum]
MPTLVTTNFNIVCSTVGGFVSSFGLVSYLFKERFYLSEALISLLAGVLFSPHAANFIRPLDYAGGSEEHLAQITLYFSRLVLGVQLVLAGVQLPSSSLLVYGMVPHFSFLHALAIGACVTPTDPVLSNSIVKGKFADQNVPKGLQKIIIAESGANDGLGYPFLFLALYLIKYNGGHGLGQTGGTSRAMGLWFGETWAYTILLSVFYGAAVGWIAKELLHRAEEKKYVDRESFLVFAITLAVLIPIPRIGTCGMIGSDDVLACFIAGNVFTWDDWFRLETLDDSLQPTIDMLLNLTVFMWFGAVCPWASFLHNDVIPLYRLIVLGILILLFRRLPVVYAMHRVIPQIEGKRQALFVGFFGPIGVSAVFYLYVSLEFLGQIKVDGEVREDARKLQDVMMVVIWFLAISSVIVHGLTIPLGKLGFYLPRTISSALESTSRDEPESPFRIQERVERVEQLQERRQQQIQTGRRPPGGMPPRPVFRIGGSLIRSLENQSQTPASISRKSSLSGNEGHHAPIQGTAGEGARSPNAKK